MPRPPSCFTALPPILVGTEPFKQSLPSPPSPPSSPLHSGRPPSTTLKGTPSCSCRHSLMYSRSNLQSSPLPHPSSPYFLLRNYSSCSSLQSQPPLCFFPFFCFPWLLGILLFQNQQSCSFRSRLGSPAASDLFLPDLSSPLFARTALRPASSARLPFSSVLPPSSPALFCRPASPPTPQCSYWLPSSTASPGEFIRQAGESCCGIVFDPDSFSPSLSCKPAKLLHSSSSSTSHLLSLNSPLLLPLQVSFSPSFSFSCSLVMARGKVDLRRRGRILQGEKE